MERTSRKMAVAVVAMFALLAVLYAISPALTQPGGPVDGGHGPTAAPTLTAGK